MMPTGEFIDVMRHNVDLFAQACDGLRANRDQLLESVKSYPLEITFVGCRFVVVNEDEYDALINVVADKVSLYRQREEAVQKVSR